MRQAHLRTLATRGIEFRGLQNFKGLEAYEAIDGRGSELLIFSGRVFGPNWVSIGYALEQSGIRYELLHLGRTFFLVNDTQELRKLLGEMKSASRKSSRDEIFVQDIGFMASDVRRKFDSRVLIAPALILGVTVSVSLFQPSDSGIKPEDTEPTIRISCALDLAEVEFEVWLQDQIEKASTEAGQLVIATDLGIVNLEVRQALGSTLLIHGSLTCQDGRSRDLQFRTDSLQGGSLVELGERLDP